MEDAEIIVRGLLNKLIVDRNYDALIDVSVLENDGSNVTSKLFKATIKTKDETKVKLFGKVANFGEQIRKQMKADTLFATENIVYTELFPVYKSIQEKRGINMITFPEIFAIDMTVGRETLIMEDLNAKGFRTPVRQNAVDWKFAAAAVSKLAALHALSFAYEITDPEAFTEITDRLRHKQTPPTEESKEVMGKIIAGALSVVKDEFRGRLIEVLKSENWFHRFKSPLSKTVLVHGDYRSSNMLYKEQGGEIEIIPVDYQTVHSGCPVSDLLYFIFLGTDQEFRRRYHDDLLQFYHKELVAALRRLGVDDAVYTKEVFENEVKEFLPLTLCMSSVVLPIVLVDDNATLNMGADASVDNFVVKPNKQFAHRFAELVEDCAEWGAL